jgi:hypothetical protein
MEAGDINALIAACIRYGDAAAGGDPQLWAEALQYLCAQPGASGGRARVCACVRTCGPRGEGGQPCDVLARTMLL